MGFGVMRDACCVWSLWSRITACPELVERACQSPEFPKSRGGLILPKLGERASGLLRLPANEIHRHGRCRPWQTAV